MRIVRAFGTLVVIAALVVGASPVAGARARIKVVNIIEVLPPSTSVVALIDTGINPYSPAFRDDTSLAGKPPWKYIPGYPKNTPALRLSLGLPYEKAIKKDADIWA
ncbi:MAG TPA: hypothetical protein VIG64_06775, partial [Actinomycetota bacterium]